ncbi:MAG: hypothetical protein K2I30_03125 [Clostridia bacterium]|nr:hypothetical protein [Clostridia bacterium]
MTKKSKIILAFTLVFVLLFAAVFTAWLAFASDNKKYLTPESEAAALPDIGGMTITDDNIKSNGISLMSAKIATAEYSDYGISAQAESAYTLTASLTPNDANNQLVDWALTWKNPSAAWANGKAVTDYVTITTAKDGALTANISSLQALGEQIIVTCTSRDNPNAKASCTVDYAQKLTSYKLSFGNVEINLGGDTNVIVEINPNGDTVGGAANVQLGKSDTYTLAETFTYTVTLLSEYMAYGTSNDGQIRLNGHAITGCPYQDYEKPISSLYFDYTNEISHWFIMGRSKDILFKDLSTAELVPYFANIENSHMYYIALDITGKYSSFRYLSHVKCAGYKNTASVQSLTLNNSSIVL